MLIKLLVKDWVYILYFKFIYWYIVLLYLDIIQYNGCQKEEHSMEINIASLGQPIQSSNDQEKYFAIKCNFKSSYKEMYTRENPY